MAEQQTADLQSAQLSDRQPAALQQVKTHTDFNALAMRTSLGREGLERQVKAKVGRVIREDEEKRERVQAQEQKPIEKQQPRRVARIAWSGGGRSRDHLMSMWYLAGICWRRPRAQVSDKPQHQQRFLLHSSCMSLAMAYVEATE